MKKMVLFAIVLKILFIFVVINEIDILKRYIMGQLAFLKMFLLVSIPTDINDNRRHVHVFKKGTRHMRSIAKIWIEQNGKKCVEIAESQLSAKDNEIIVAAIEKHWEFINDQITKTFRGEKTKIKNIEK